jgi:hypothetical protein
MGKMRRSLNFQRPFPFYRQTIHGKGVGMTKLLKLLIPVITALGLVLIGGCATSRETPTPLPTPAPSQEVSKGRKDLPLAVVEEPTLERKIVKTGYMTLEVEDISEAMTEISHLAEELGGYVVSSNRQEFEKGTSGDICIRVPSEKFQDALVRLRQLAVRVASETTRAVDVTEEYIDLEARLHNLRATEAQFLTLLQKAENVEEMLMVQRELSNVRMEIEQTEGRMKYLERTSELALIELTLREVKPLAGPWSPLQAFKAAIRGLVAFVRGLVTVLIWLGVFCWAWVPPVVIWLRKRKKK